MNYHGGGARGHYHPYNSLKTGNDSRFNTAIPNGMEYNHDALFGRGNRASAFPQTNDGKNNSIPRNFQQPFHQQAKSNNNNNNNNKNNNNLQRFRSQPDLLMSSQDYKLADQPQYRNVPSNFRDPFRDPYMSNTIQRQPYYPSNTARVDPTSSYFDRRDYNSRLPAQNGAMQRWASSDNIHRRPTQEFSDQPSSFHNQKFNTLTHSSNSYSAPQNSNGLRYPQQYPTVSNGFRTLPPAYKTSSPIKRDRFLPEADQNYPPTHNLVPYNSATLDRTLGGTSRNLPNPDYVNSRPTRNSHLHLPGISRSEDGTNSRFTPPFGQRNGRTNTPMSAPAPSSTWRPTLLPSRFQPRTVGGVGSGGHSGGPSKYQSVSSDNSYNPGRTSVNKIYFNSAHTEANQGLPRRSKSYVDLVGSVNGPNESFSPPKPTSRPFEDPNYPQIRPSNIDPGTKFRDPGNFNRIVPDTPPSDNAIGSHEASDQTLDDEWSLSGFSNVGSDTQMGSASFESEHSPSSGNNGLRQTIFDPGHVDRLVSHLKTLPKVPGPNQNLAFKKNQEMSQALHSIQHIDKFRTESMIKKKPERFSIYSKEYSPGADIESSTYDTSVVNNNPLSPDEFYSSGSINDEDQGYSKPTNEYSQNEYTEMIKPPQNEVANGVLLRRNRDGSQDIEIFRTAPGASFGFYVYKEPETLGDKSEKLTGNSIRSHNIDRRGGLFISRLSEGSRIAGLLNVGDKVLKINNQETQGMTLDQIEHLIINSRDSVFLTTLPYLVSIQDLQQ